MFLHSPIQEGYIEAIILLHALWRAAHLYLLLVWPIKMQVSYTRHSSYCTSKAFGTLFKGDSFSEQTP